MPNQGRRHGQAQLSVAVGDYDRTRALIDGAVQIDGVDPVYMTLVPEEIFFRAFRAAEFDICEVVAVELYGQDRAGQLRPISRCRLSCRAPSVTPRSMCAPTASRSRQDLKGRKVGVPEYQLTANVWARAFLEDDYGVKRSDIHWIRGGIEHAGRPEKITVKLPPGVRLDNAPEGKTISALLDEGEIDGFIAPRPPTLVEKGHPHIGWLFPDPIAVAKDYFKRTGFFPIMHAVGIRRELAEETSVAAGRGAQGVRASKEAGLAKLSDTSATKVTLPFVEERLAEARDADGPRFLVLRRRAEPQGAGLFPRPASCRRPVVAARRRRRTVSSGDLRDVQVVVSPSPRVRGEGRDEGALELPERGLLSVALVFDWNAQKIAAPPSHPDCFANAKRRSDPARPFAIATSPRTRGEVQ